MASGLANSIAQPREPGRLGDNGATLRHHVPTIQSGQMMFEVPQSQYRDRVAVALLRCRYLDFFFIFWMFIFYLHFSKKKNSL